MLKKFSAALIAFMMIFCFTACGSSDSSSGGVMSGNRWRGSDGTLLDLADDGSYKYYRDSNSLADNYYKGDYTVRIGQAAIDYLNSEHGIAEDSQRQIMQQYGVEDKNYYVLTLNNKERIVEGKNDLGEPNKVEFFGYYSETGKYLNFKNLKTLSQIDFYKV